MGLIFFASWTARGNLLAGIVSGVITTLVWGVVGTVRLARREDARTVSDWARSRTRAG
jgi:hypothetical protein